MILLIVIVILSAFSIWSTLYLYDRLQHQKMLYETVSTWNEYLTQKIKEYESKMDPNVFTFKYAERKLCGIGEEKYSCYFLGSSDDGKQLRKYFDFTIKPRSELPVLVLEAEEIKK